MDDAPDGSLPRRSVLITPRSALLAVAVVLGVLVVRNVFVAAHRVIGWAVAAAIVAILLKPAVDGVARWMPRLLAVVLIALAVAGVVGVVVSGVFDDLRTETAALREEGPEAAERLADRDDRVGRVARDLRLPERAEDAFDALEERFAVDDRALASAAGALPAYFVSFILTIFLMFHGPGIVKGSLDQLSEPRRQRWEAALYSGVARARRYLWVAMAQGMVVGFATYALAEAWTLPASTVLGLVAGALATVPYIGVLIGSSATILLTAGFRSVGWALVVFVVVALLQVGEALVLRRMIDRRTLHIGPAVPVIVGTIGLDLYGIGGAVFAMAAAVLVMGVMDAAADDETALPTPSDDWIDAVPDPDRDPVPDPVPDPDPEADPDNDPEEASP